MVAQRGVGSVTVVVLPVVLGHDLGLEESVEDLDGEEFIA